MKTYKYSETFFSAQGEGRYTGRPSLWIRFFLCNLQCNGFGQDEPTNPDSWELPYETIDLTDIERVEDLPVFDKGCDSSYTWAKKFRHLMKDKTVPDIVDELTALLPYGKFEDPQTGVWHHMVFTGGEPMINQTAIYEILQEFERRGNLPRYVTVETNGTKPLTEDGRKALELIVQHPDGEWLWSVSPKLWSTAGEKPERAFKPKVIEHYADCEYIYRCCGSVKTQLKWVVNGSDESWDEVEQHRIMLEHLGVNFEPWIMGVGGTIEGLKLTEADIADEAIRSGYNYSTRAHCHIYGNAIGK